MISVAKGDLPTDLVLVNTRVVNIVTGNIGLGLVDVNQFRLIRRGE